MAPSGARRFKRVALSTPAGGLKFGTVRGPNGYDVIIPEVAVTAAMSFAFGVSASDIARRWSPVSSEIANAIGSSKVPGDAGSYALRRILADVDKVETVPEYGVCLLSMYDTTLKGSTTSRKFLILNLDND